MTKPEPDTLELGELEPMKKKKALLYTSFKSIDQIPLGLYESEYLTDILINPVAIVSEFGTTGKFHGKFERTNFYFKNADGEFLGIYICKSENLIERIETKPR